MIYKNAFYKVNDEVYFVNRVVVDCDREYRIYCKKCEVNNYNKEEKFYSYNQNAYTIGDQEVEVFVDFFDSAIFLNSLCSDCIYFVTTDIDDILFPTSGPEDEEIHFAICSLRRYMNRHETNYLEALSKDDIVYTELYSNCQFHETQNQKYYLKQMYPLQDISEIGIIKGIANSFLDFKDDAEENATVKGAYYHFKNSMINPYQFEYLLQITSPETKIYFTRLHSLLNLLLGTSDPNILRNFVYGYSDNITIPQYNALASGGFYTVFTDNWFVTFFRERGLYIAGNKELLEMMESLE